MKPRRRWGGMSDLTRTRKLPIDVDSGGNNLGNVCFKGGARIQSMRICSFKEYDMGLECESLTIVRFNGRQHT
jgi:hypothetical protein